MKTARLLIVLLIVLVSVAAFGQSPVIVAQVSVLNQNSRIPPTILVTPVTSGIYRISVYMVASKISTSHWSLGLSWTDEVQDQNTPHFWVQVPANVFSTYSHATQIVRAVAGKPINYSVAGNARGVTYNLFITVEQLESD